MKYRTHFETTARVRALRAAPRIAVTLALAFLLLTGCTMSPEEAATLTVHQVSNRFETAAAVAIDDHHLITHLDIVRHVSAVTLRNAAGDSRSATVVGQDDVLKVALLEVDGEELTYARTGSSAGLLGGDQLLSQSFNGAGKATQHTGRIVRWVYAESRAFLESNLDTPASSAGAGVFDPYGNLIGIQILKKEIDQTFILPIEYLTNGDAALLASLLGAQSDDVDFTAQRQEAEKSPTPMIEKMHFEDVDSRHALSSKSFVGAMRMLSSNKSPMRDKAASYRIEAAGAGGNQRVISKGKLAKANVRWVPLPSEYKEVIDLQIEEFGELWVEDILATNAYGELRFRIPLAPFCSKVSAGDTHAVTVTVEDKRSTGRLIFSGFADACAGTGDDNGDAMESELFSGAVAKAPAAPSGKSGKTSKKAKKKGKNKKKKKKKKRKKR